MNQLPAYANGPSTWLPHELTCRALFVPPCPGLRCRSGEDEQPLAHCAEIGSAHTTEDGLALDMHTTPSNGKDLSSAHFRSQGLRVVGQSGSWFLIPGVRTNAPSKLSQALNA